MLLIIILDASNLPLIDIILLSALCSSLLGLLWNLT